MAYVTFKGTKYKVGHPTYAPEMHNGWIAGEWRDIGRATDTANRSLVIYAKPGSVILACMYTPVGSQRPVFQALSQYEMTLIR